MEFLSLSRVCLQKLLNLSSTRPVLPYLCQTAPFLEQLRTAPRRPKPGSPTACCCCGYLPAGLGCARLVMAAASVAWGASAPGLGRPRRLDARGSGPGGGTVVARGRRCRMNLPGPTTSVGIKTDYSVGPWDYSVCVTRHLMT
jgi:hypothetical protein